jgi:hypothetical protein
VPDAAPDAGDREAAQQRVEADEAGSDGASQLNSVFCGRSEGREARSRRRAYRIALRMTPQHAEVTLEEASHLRHAGPCMPGSESYHPLFAQRTRQVFRWSWAISCLLGGAWLLIGSFAHWWAAGFPPQERAQWHGALGDLFFAAAIGVAAIGVFGVRALRPRNEATVLPKAALH